MNQKQKANTLFPGRPGYKGPRKGIFGLLHHDRLVESSHDVVERVHHIKTQKPQKDVKTRLHNLIYRGHCRAVAKLTLLSISKSTFPTVLGTGRN